MRVVQVAAVGTATVTIAAFAGASAVPVASAQEPVSPPVEIEMKLHTTGLSSYKVQFRGGDGNLLDYPRHEWFLDGAPIPQAARRPNFWIDEPRDGKLHVLTVRFPRKDLPGTTYEVSRTYRAPRPLTISAPAQSARIARARGIAVRVSAAYGYYRVRTRSARIPAAASVNIDARDGGEKRARLRGSYLDRIKPGTRVKIRAQRLSGGEALETAVVTVAFR